MFKRTHATLASVSIPAIVAHHADGIAAKTFMTNLVCSNNKCKTNLTFNNIANPACLCCKSDMRVKANSDVVVLSAKEVSQLYHIAECASCSTHFAATSQLANKLVKENSRGYCPICTEAMEFVGADDDSDDVGDDAPDNAGDDEDGSSMDGSDDDSSDKDEDEDEDEDSDDDSSTHAGTDDDDDDTGEDSTIMDDDDSSGGGDDSGADASDDLTDNTDTDNSDSTDDDSDASGDDTDSTDDDSDASGDDTDSDSDSTDDTDSTDDDSDATPTTDDSSDDSDDSTDDDSDAATDDKADASKPDADDDDDDSKSSMVASIVKSNKTKKITITVASNFNFKKQPLSIYESKGKLFIGPDKRAKIKVNAFNNVIASIPADAKIDLLRIGVEADTRWFLFANEQPIAIAHYKNAKPSLQKIFATDQFSTTLMIAAEEEGLTKEVTEDFGFKPVNVEIDVPEATKQEVQNSTEASVKKYKLSIEAAASKLESCAGIAAMGMMKGVFKDCPNPLRAALIDSLAANGMRKPESLVDSVLSEVGEDMLKSIFSKARELTSKSDEALEEVASMVKDVDYRVNVVAELAKPSSKIPFAAFTNHSSNTDEESSNKPTVASATIHDLTAGLGRKIVR